MILQHHPRGARPISEDTEIEIQAYMSPGSKAAQGLVVWPKFPGEREGMACRSSLNLWWSFPVQRQRNKMTGFRRYTGAQTQVCFRPTGRGDKYSRRCRNPAKPQDRLAGVE